MRMRKKVLMKALMEVTEKLDDVTTLLGALVKVIPYEWVEQVNEVTNSIDDSLGCWSLWGYRS